MQLGYVILLPAYETILRNSIISSTLVGPSQAVQVVGGIYKYSEISDQSRSSTRILLQDDRIEEQQITLLPGDTYNIYLLVSAILHI